MTIWNDGSLTLVRGAKESVSSAHAPSSIVLGVIRGVLNTGNVYSIFEYLREHDQFLYNVVTSMADGLAPAEYNNRDVVWQPSDGDSPELRRALWRWSRMHWGEHPKPLRVFSNGLTELIGPPPLVRLWGLIRDRWCLVTWLGGEEGELPDGTGTSRWYVRGVHSYRENFLWLPDYAVRETRPEETL